MSWLRSLWRSSQKELAALFLWAIISFISLNHPRFSAKTITSPAHDNAAKSFLWGGGCKGYFFKGLSYAVVKVLAYVTMRNQQGSWKFCMSTRLRKHNRPYRLVSTRGCDLRFCSKGLSFIGECVLVLRTVKSISSTYITGSILRKALTSNLWEPYILGQHGVVYLVLWFALGSVF